jgi:starch synthase (maltosyl-transferring)
VKKRLFFLVFDVSTFCSIKKGAHGTFKDVEENVIPRVKSLGFDVLYIPPIHPIGHQFRKGKNNSTTCEPGEPGVPYGIGSDLGGHTAILPELGTLDDLKHLIQTCQDNGIELAMDLAIQCSPDHPYTKEHPEWFKVRPDGTIQYAENPPKNTKIFTLSTLSQKTGKSFGMS